MLAVLKDLGVEKYIEKDSKPPKAADKANLTKDEEEAEKRWKDVHTKACMHIELSISGLPYQQC